MHRARLGVGANTGRASVHSKDPVEAAVAEELQALDQALSDLSRALSEAVRREEDLVAVGEALKVDLRSKEGALKAEEGLATQLRSPGGWTTSHLKSRGDRPAPAVGWAGGEAAPPERGGEPKDSDADEGWSRNTARTLTFANAETGPMDEAYTDGDRGQAGPPPATPGVEAETSLAGGEVDTILDRLAQEARRRRLDVRDEFKPHDKYR